MPSMKTAGAQALAPDLLRKWLGENRRAQPEWRIIAQRLAEDLDMAQVWAAVGDENAILLFTAVRHALDGAETESARMRAKDERKALLRVKAAALALKEAIERSPFPRAKAQPIALPGEGDLAPLTIQVAWRTAPVGFRRHSLQLPDLMDTVAGWVDAYVTGLPPRFAQRAKADARWPAFARQLSFLLCARSIKVTPTHLAIIMNAALARYDDPFTPDQVKAFLRTSQGT